MKEHSICNSFYEKLNNIANESGIPSAEDSEMNDLQIQHDVLEKENARLQEKVMNLIKYVA